MVEISIIVPVYNLESYLSKCIDSILSQTFNEFELILVNDGSTDGSGNLCDVYQKQDSRVKVIHKENGGVASSRNAGLKIAEGNYIGFVDNDDYINKYMFDILYNTALKSSSDIVICDYMEVEEEQYGHIKHHIMDDNVLHYNNIEALNQLYTDHNITFVVPWNKLYKRHLFKDIQYEVGNSNDDETVAHKLLYYSEKITYIQMELYYYVQRKGSQMDSRVPFQIKRFDAVYALKERELFFRKVKEWELQQKALKHYLEKFFWYYYLGKSSLEGIDKELRKLKRTFDESLFNLLKLENISWKQKSMCVIFSINPSLYGFIKGCFEKEKESKQSGV